MEILKKYKDEEEDWFETTLAKCLDHTENNGYWKKGTVKNMLEEGIEIQTPFAVYKKKIKEN